MLQGISKSIEFQTSIAHATLSATTTGSEINIQNADKVTIGVYVSAAGTADASNYLTFTVNQATATGGSFAAAETTQYVVADSWDRLINDTGEAGWFLFDFIPAPGKGFIKVIATETSNTSITYSAHVFEAPSVLPANS